MPVPDVLAAPAALAAPDALSDPGLAPVDPGESFAGAFEALADGDELPDTAGLVSADDVGLAELVALGVTFGLAVWLGLAVSQLVWLVLGVGVLWLAVVVAVAVAVAAAEELALALPLAVAPLLAPLAGGLTTELDGEDDGLVGATVAEAGGLDDELALAVEEGEADACGHDAIGVGS